MHILFLSDNFPPEVNAPASRTYEHCREWVKEGHKVTVITCAPNFPTGKIFEGYKNRLWQREDVAGIEVVRVWSYVTANEGFLKRTADYLSFMVSAILAGVFVRRPDVIVGTSPQFFTAVAAHVVGALRRTPWVFELRDIWPESIKAVGALREGRLLRWLERAELYLYRNAALIVAVTHAFKANLVARGIDADKIKVITNGVDLSRYAPRGKDMVLEAELDLIGCFVVGYIGTHGMAHALETILDSAELLAQDPKGRNVRILMLGDGACKARLVAEAGRRKLDNIIFKDSVPKDEVVRYWSLLDTAIIHLRKTPLFETTIPSKIFEAMSMGIPLAMGVAGEAASIVAEAQAGLMFEPENPQELTEVLLRIREDVALRNLFREGALRASRQYDRLYLAHRMLGDLTAVWLR